MWNTENIAFLIIMVVVFFSTLIYEHIIFRIELEIWLKKAMSREQEWCKVNKVYLQILRDCGEKPIEDVTYAQMRKRINKHYEKRIIK